MCLWLVRSDQREKEPNQREPLVINVMENVSPLITFKELQNVGYQYIFRGKHFVVNYILRSLSL